MSLFHQRHRLAQGGHHRGARGLVFQVVQRFVKRFGPRRAVVTNAVKCVPPQNKPDRLEIKRCNRYLRSELEILKPGTCLLALGHIAHRAVLSALECKAANFPFRHGARYCLPRGLALYDSYHCSRYNTQTRRLTEAMFHQVFVAIARDLGK